MNCVVVGGGGFIGSHLVEALSAHGHAVTIFDRPEARYFNFHTQPGIHRVEGDFFNSADLQSALIGCEVVFHLVSTTVPQTSNENPAFDVEANLIGTIKLLEIARNLHVKKIIFASSGGTVYGIPMEIPIKENHPTEPISSYGITKLTIEKYLHYYWHAFGLDYCILRISNAYGERQPVTETQGVISSFLARVTRQEEITVWGDGSVIRDYIYVGDIAGAFIKAIEYEGNLKIFNIGAGQGHSINDIIGMLENVTQKPLMVRYAPARNFDVPINILDITRAGVHLGWKPETSLLEGLTYAFDWMIKKL